MLTHCHSHFCRDLHQISSTRIHICAFDASAENPAKFRFAIYRGRFSLSLSLSLSCILSSWSFDIFVSLSAENVSTLYHNGSYPILVCKFSNSYRRLAEISKVDTQSTSVFRHGSIYILMCARARFLRRGYSFTRRWIKNVRDRRANRQGWSRVASVYRAVRLSSARQMPNSSNWEEFNEKDPLLTTIERQADFVISGLGDESGDT